MSTALFLNEKARRKEHKACFHAETGCYWLPAGNPFPVRVGFCPDEANYNKLLAHLGLEGKDDYMMGASARVHQYSKNGMEDVLVLTVADDIIGRGIEGLAGLIAHEALHMVDFTKEAMGEPNELSCETRTYLLQYYTTQLLYYVLIARPEIIAPPVTKRQRLRLRSPSDE